jgi:hypothetical protein
MKRLKSVVHCLKHGTETAVLSNGPIGKNVTLALANLNNQQLPIMILHSLNPWTKKNYILF